MCLDANKTHLRWRTGIWAPKKTDQYRIEANASTFVFVPKPDFSHVTTAQSVKVGRGHTLCRVGQCLYRGWFRVRGRVSVRLRFF